MTGEQKHNNAEMCYTEPVEVRAWNLVHL